MRMKFGGNALVLKVSIKSDVLIKENKELEKGKPLERVGRKATGLNPEDLGTWRQGCQANTAPSSGCRSFRLEGRKLC